MPSKISFLLYAQKYFTTIEMSFIGKYNDRKMTDKAVWMFIHGHIINVISTSARVKS